MRAVRWPFFLISLAVVALVVAVVKRSQPEVELSEESDDPPGGWFYSQRAYPHEYIDRAGYLAAAEQARGLQGVFAKENHAGEWRLAGPTNIGGRITSIAVDPANPSVMYAGAAMGGVLRSIDAGITWNSIFEGLPSQAVGDVAVAPSDPTTIYVGTGEANGSKICYGGMGVFRSTDAGVTWQHRGLDSVAAIGRVLVDPLDPQRLYVAAMGDQWRPDPGGGLYRSTDGGGTWRKIISGNDSTGCIEIILHPSAPRTLFAATWERRVRYASSRYGGVGSALRKSTDGGDTWTEITAGLPVANRGRIGLAIAPLNPKRMYAIYSDIVGSFVGFYRSDDGGTTWSTANASYLRDGVFYNTYGWWFGGLRVDPANPDMVYAFGVPLLRSSDAGETWESLGDGALHSDHHALYIDPADPNRLVSGSDGGITISTNRGATWDLKPNLAITQFYTCEIDYLHPERLYGGAQDNFTSRTLTGARDDWSAILGGDGFHVLVDPTNSDRIFAEYQYGNLWSSDNGGLSMDPAMNGISATDRFNWNTPVVFDPSNPRVLYYGTQRLYRLTESNGWTPISGDLTNGGAGGVVGTITAIAVAPADPEYIYAGCDDGNVSVTMNGGQSWTRVPAGKLPVRWVTSIAVDPLNPGTAYVGLSGYRFQSYTGHVFRTTDAGGTWQDLSKNLPEAPVNAIVIDPVNPAHLFVATDFGVFYSVDLAGGWRPLGSGLPNVPVSEIKLHRPTNKLLAATFGRSMYTIDVSPVTGVGAMPVAAVAPSLTPRGPNPFFGFTALALTLPGRAEVRAEIFDARGRLIRTLLDALLESGTHQLVWDGLAGDGRRPGPGAYYCRVRAGDVSCSARLLLMR